MTDFPLCKRTGLTIYSVGINHKNQCVVLLSDLEHLLASAPVVYGNKSNYWYANKAPVHLSEKVLPDIHSARLLLIEEIKPADTAEQLIKELIAGQEFSKIGVTVITDDWVVRARRLLEGEK